MKTNLLTFRRVLNATLVVLLLSVVGMTNAFAQMQVATLQHGEEMSAFYGPSALIEANNAAEDGDIITLSSGTFNFKNNVITKAITIHGAGCVSDILGITPTIVSGECSIDVPNDTDYLVIEGVSFQNQIRYYSVLHYAKFIKCNVSDLNETNIGYHMGNDVQFINCYIGSAGINSVNNCVSMINCVVNALYHTHYNSESDYINIYNSVICEIPSYNTDINLYNCIVGTRNDAQITNSYAYNCIEIGSVFSNSVYANDCMSVDSYSDVFESFDGTFSFDADVHLKEEIATSFLGNDGSQVGIYGGMMPYNPRPSYLILNRCNVAGQSTIDGKLSVDIEIINGDN